jgi:RNA-directed DNA polymerase
MTVTSTGAASHNLDWQAIDWHAVHGQVRRLQSRIVKAVQAGRWGKVKALQRLLTHSFSGKVLAVRRVTENSGKQTPGIDGLIWNSPAKKAAAIDSLQQHGYRAQPLRRVYIPKSNGRRRPLGIPTMKDRALQALYLLALDPIAETTADPNSYGFRRERATADAIAQCFRCLCMKGAAKWILEGDIKSCFDRLSHDWLLAHIPMPKAILRSWLKAGFMEQAVLHSTEAGTPQGGIASPVLANLALDGLEKLLHHRFPKRQHKVHLVRYADDFIVTASSKAMLETEVKPLIEGFLCERGLELSPEKTRITHIEDGFDFLGQNLRKYGDKLLIKPAASNVKSFLAQIRQLVKTNRATPAGELIRQLNPKIKGWANYHRHIVSKTAFIKVDQAIFNCLYRWMKRRHPMKSRKWIKAKYFDSIDGRHWVFSGQISNQEGQLRRLHLESAAKTAIQRHVKIKGQANPYDAKWETYFEQRLGVKMAANLRGRRALFYLWREQQGRCLICQEKITRLTGWHNHHLVWRVNGGTDGADNRVLLHPECHRQVHSQRLTVVKPRPTRA